jgi:hypothetical protein
MAADYRFKFIADESFVHEIRVEAAQQPDQIRIEGESTEKDATRLGFDLATASAIVAIISGTLNIVQISAKFYNWLQKSDANKVVIQTPFQTLELSKNSGVTQEDVQKMLEASLKI